MPPNVFLTNIVQNAFQCVHIVRQMRFEMHAFTCGRVTEFQIFGMQHLTIMVTQKFQQIWVACAGQPPRCATIDRIAQDRKTVCRQVDAYLVRTAGQQITPKCRHARARPHRHNIDLCMRGFSPRFDHCHFLAIA